MKPTSGQAGRSPYTSSGAGLAIICGVVAAFFFSPILYGLTISFVMDTAYRYYPASAFHYIGYGAWAVWAGIVFFLIRALIYAVFVKAGFVMGHGRG